ncbi:HNH endonuclease [Bullifex porci]|uniref:HNH endonuclease n=1 Tax=Bullifex porci TaxID=2606638 RepID=UPI0023F1E4AD|nr:HNH endonuclease [Bullifex porci]MDD7256054.1 HNH endonuclease [Bullifex porci]MDY2741741.1 HNH endonuclease [Bullifex porci]
MDRTGIKWNEDEITLCLGLYYLYSSGVVSFDEGATALGKLLGRTRGSVGFKLGNIANCDNPNKGFSNINKLDMILFKRYVDDIDSLFLNIKKILRLDSYKSLDSSILLKNNPYCNNDIESLVAESLVEKEKTNSTIDYASEDKESIVRVREKQWAFRTALLTNYDRTCCISGIKTPQLLVASHIVPWAADKSKRLNPANGLLLNPILDKAFDQGFITFHPEKHSLIISDKIKDEKTIEYLSPFENCILATPKHKSASPAKENLEYHNDVIFNSFVNKKGNNILYPELG